VWGRLSHRRLRDAAGSPIGTVTTIEDITAGRLAMEELALRDQHDLTTLGPVPPLHEVVAHLVGEQRIVEVHHGKPRSPPVRETLP
jgi:hypothetical protein